ncbi:MAG: hypothetical protein HND44_10465 [Chloroflexi bacterium]|nr:hypothetical protein [Ardenticatenaceae bacterium]MBL1128900.1 hypothetical protein [Chloroflexota bacterium]NOG34979.1 hypothetical protein [Chloroflexota bacterium]
MRIPKRDIELTYLDWRVVKLASLVILMAIGAFFITQSLGDYLLAPSGVSAPGRVIDAASVGFLLVCIPAIIALAVFIVAVCISLLDTRYSQPGVETRWAVMGGLYGFLIPVGSMIFQVIPNIPVNSGVQAIIGGLLIGGWLISPFLLVFKLFPVPDYEIQSNAPAE